jgi:hypothetical protein
MLFIQDLILTDNIDNYQNQCIEIIANSYTEFIIREEIMKTIYIASFKYYIKYIDKYFHIKPLDIHKIPFYDVQYRLNLNIIELEKDDERKMIFQSIFLMVLRLKISYKYKNISDFLAIYPEFTKRNTVEQKRLFNFANCYDLLFYTMKAHSNKGFSLNIVTRLCEGRDIKYNTGSGQTEPTSDRVLIFYRESNTSQGSRKRNIKKLNFVNF